MADETVSSIIKDGDQVVIRKDKILKVLQVRKDRNVFIEKVKIALGTLIGKSYGTTFEVHKGGKPVIVDTRMGHDADCDIDEKSGTDNRHVSDNKDNQKMSREDLIELKKSGVSGEGIVEQLIEQSSTFKDKTEFAQQKYIKKKKKKYIPLYTILKPSARLLCEMYNNKGPTKICCMRVDSLAQILAQANVRPHNKMMVVESCVGLVLGAVMERMAGQGTLVQFYNGSAPIRQAMAAFDFPQHYFKSLFGFPLELISTITKKDSTSVEKCEPEDLSVSAQARVTDSTVTCEHSDSTQNHVQTTESNLKSGANSNNDLSEKTNAETPSGGDLPLDLRRDKEPRSSAEHSGMSGSKSICDTVSETDVKSQDKTTEMDEGKNEDIEDMILEDEDSLMEDEVCKEEENSDGQRGKSAKWNQKCGSAKRQKKRLPWSEEEKMKRRENRLNELQKTREIIEKADMDGLIVATRFHPTPIVMALVDYVLPARPIVVFCQYKEPLLDCYQKLRDRGGILLLKLTETWLREYQVLRDRTHPKMQMSGTGGYLLTGLTVCRD